MTQDQREEWKADVESDKLGELYDHEPLYCSVCSATLYDGPYEPPLYSCEGDGCDAVMCADCKVEDPRDSSCALCPKCAKAMAALVNCWEGC